MVIGSPAFEALTSLLHTALRHGDDLSRLLRDAVRIDSSDVHDLAAVLHYRISRVVAPEGPAHTTNDERRPPSIAISDAYRHALAERARQINGPTAPAAHLGQQPNRLRPHDFAAVPVPPPRALPDPGFRLG